ncbi:glycosyltransferase family 8 protein [Trametes cingulata]|nr:glycosyltransferase family 8 protein [Trametes cingulata]
MSRRAYLALLTTKDYLPGLLVLHKSLVDAGSKYPLVVMATPALPQEVRDVVIRRGIDIRDVDPLYPRDGLHQLAAHDIRFAETWTKLRVFELVEYDRLVMLDADMVVRRNMDELMDLDLPPDHIAAVHVCACNPRKLDHYPKDWTPENCPHSAVTHPEGLVSPPRITETSPRPYNQLNSGVVILHPSLEVFSSLRNFLEESPLVPTFSFPDQDLLAEHFKGRWRPLPWCYNALKTLRDIHPDLWRDEEVRCVHYILHDKPWKNRPGAGNPQYAVVNQWWWDVFEKLRAEMEVSDPEGWKLVEGNVAAA